MPPQFIIIGMPEFIIPIMFWQHCMNASFIDASIGAISQVMPFGVMVQVIRHIIIGIAMPGMPPIIGIAIIGIMPPIIIGFMPPIIGVMPPIIGIIVCIVAFIAGSIGVRRILLRLSLFGVGVFDCDLNTRMNMPRAFLQQVAALANTAEEAAAIVDVFPISRTGDAGARRFNRRLRKGHSPE